MTSLMLTILSIKASYTSPSRVVYISKSKGKKYSSQNNEMNHYQQESWRIWKKSGKRECREITLPFCVPDLSWASLRIQGDLFLLG